MEIGHAGDDRVLKKSGKESLQEFMHNMAQLRDVMESIGFHEVAVAAQESYDAANRYWLFLKELEVRTPGWMMRLISK
jgi:hypothetical protein